IDFWTFPILSQKKIYLQTQTYVYSKLKHVKKPRELNDPVAEHLLFKHVQQNIIQELYPCPERIACVLAAIELQSKYGDNDPHKHRTGYLNKIGLSEFLPQTVSRHDYAYWQERLFSIHRKLAGTTQREAIKKYIDVARQIPYFGMTFFELEDDVKARLLLGVAEDGLFLFNTANLSLLHCVTFRSLVAWTKKDVGFDIMFEEEDIVQSLTLITSDVKRKEILDLLDEYYVLLPDDWRNSMKKPNNSKPVVLDRPVDYLPPQKRTFMGRFGSRLEFLKGYYMECCAQSKHIPLRSMCCQIDACIDNEVPLNKLDLCECNLDNQGLDFILKSIGKALAFSPEVIFQWKENLDLQEIDFSDNFINVEEYRFIFSFLDFFPKMKHINLSGNLVGNQGAILLSKCIEKLKSIESIRLNNCDIGNKGLTELLSSIRGRSTFKVLECAKNRVADKTLSLLGKLLDDTYLSVLNLSGNKIDAGIIDAGILGSILKPLDISKRIEVVDLSDCNLNTKAGIRIALFLESNKNIQELRISGNKFNSEVFVKIGLSLRTNTSLVKLDLSNNMFGDKITDKQIKEAIGFVSKPTSQLEELNISNCCFDYIFADEFAKILTTNSKLSSINLSQNPISKVGTPPSSWKDALSAGHIKKLCMSRCDLTGTGLLNFMVSIAGVQLDELILDGCEPIGDIRMLQEFFANCRSKLLSLSDSKITDDLLAMIGPSLGKNRNIEILILNDNLLSKDGLERLTHSKINKNLSELHILRNPRLEKDAKVVAKILMDKTLLRKVLI
ncbi:hypothetical protein AKO1_013259, partial [Acrasis kona]